jgi:EmrB/QacA subfamily drug resistance transporter
VNTVIDKPRANQLLTILTICLVWFMAVLDFQMVSLSLPVIQRGLSLSPSTLQWVVSGYSLTFGGFLLLAGRIADVLGRRQTFAVGLGLFAGAAFVCGLAFNGAMLIIARTFQGLGAALMVPTGMSILLASFPEGTERNRALGYWGVAAPLGGIIGAVAGGILSDRLGWSWVFFLQLPFAAFALLMLPKITLPVTKSQDNTHLDFAGAITVTAGFATLIFALSRVQTDGFTSARVLLLLALAFLLLGAFIFVETRSSHPLVPLGIFRKRNLTGANIVTFLILMAAGPPVFFYTFYMQQLRGYSAFTTGLAYLPVNAMLVVGSFLGTLLTNKWGAKRTLGLAATLIAIGALLYARLSVTGNYLTTLLPAHLVLGLGLGISGVAGNIIATAGVDESRQGLAAGLINTSVQVGAAFGLAILVSVAASRTASLTELSNELAQIEGFRWAFYGGALFAVLGLVITLWIISDKKSRTNQDV